MDFVREQGDMLSRARAMALLQGVRPSANIIAQLEALQASSGGWPLVLESGQPEAIAGTIEMLWALLDVGLRKHEMVWKSFEFLSSLQEEDGVWQVPDADGQAAPWWLQRGEEAAYPYLTALLSSLLVAYGLSQDPTADRALDLLLNQQLADGTFVGFPRYTGWYALPILATRLGQRSGPAQNILRVTAQKFGEGGWYASQFATLLRNLLMAGYGMETPLVRNSWEQVLMRQNEDGSWTGEEEDPRAVANTLDVIWCWRKINIASR
jgi:hypothetical protein